MSKKIRGESRLSFNTVFIGLLLCLFQLCLSIGIFDQVNFTNFVFLIFGIILGRTIQMTESVSELYFVITVLLVCYGISYFL